MISPRTSEAPIGIENDYMGPTINFKIPPYHVQSDTQYPYVGIYPTHIRMPLAHPGAPITHRGAPLAHPRAPFSYHRAPYASTNP